MYANSSAVNFTETGYLEQWCQHSFGYGSKRNILTADAIHHPDAPILEGISSPYTYYYNGTPYTSFAHHYEDYWLPSVNYHYQGAEKYWIGCRASDTRAVWNTIKRVSAAYGKRPDEKRMLISPQMLQEYGNVDCTHIHQMPGDLVMSAAGATHGGCNIGQNFAEAVNFADMDGGDGWMAMLPDMVDFFLDERDKSVPDSLLVVAGLTV